MLKNQKAVYRNKMAIKCKMFNLMLEMQIKTVRYHFFLPIIGTDMLGGCVWGGDMNSHCFPFFFLTLKNFS